MAWPFRCLLRGKRSSARPKLRSHPKRLMPEEAWWDTHPELSEARWASGVKVVLITGGWLAGWVGSLGVGGELFLLV